MRAWRIESLGDSPVLANLDRPEPGPGQALVRVAAAGLNFADLLMAKGAYQDRPALPFTPGLELAGRVEALGPGTAGPPPGTRVAAATLGAFAEYALVPAETLVPLPDTMDFATAAGFLIAYGTSHLALAHRARLQPGETLFVTGAAGGVGLTAVEIGVRMGARVIASARGADRLDIARAAGAHHLIDSEAPGLKEALKDLGGIDVFYDPVGGPAFDAALRAARPEGRLIPIGFASGEVPPIPANLLLVKNLTVIGLWWGGYTRFAPALARDSLATLFDWVAEGALKPLVSHALPFDALPEALALIRDRKATGKVVLMVDPAA
ncbi:NADPH:quinone oxidoreductase family protein [Neotabrizicola shimadae]|uniref:NADPH:quinone oxidoreductase family protein n=1 Tax=Neotabrizicola shimadae TaxID=2807096 RepID=A0A8G0ZZ79_9RHOB|nr:NADPH:quinone oxidoreductase family protein [Neotabrizicola shimadae]QYZ71693.1 NADPH:quinone oxidoreductase family protein [Neotabrizicola shimadae]